ncbi:MAG: hypothetical protein IJJ71_09105 [Treponema sp.]|uniref:hypothetical protein n=1 Tax=Treponema sp. TaxID=166 RepID=UPI0025EC5FEB|nr:hypothetical protein [Treponema sp.]MBR0496317.1 hypothetical protein [Treponema sp.]
MLSRIMLKFSVIVLIFTISIPFSWAWGKKKQNFTIGLEQDFGIGDIGNSQSDTAQANEVKQPFSWVSAGDVLKYEIIIERFDEGAEHYLPYFFHETNEEETKSCIIYIDPVLPVGQYRSEIKVYNILGKLEQSLTSHDEFTVRQAYKPEIRSVSYPLYMRSTIYLDDLDNDGIIEVEGRNLFMPDPEDKAIVHTKYFLKGSRTIYPEEVLSIDELRNRKIKFRFDMKKLEVGRYDFFAQDASGLHSEASSDSEFTVKFKKWMDLDIQAGYTCPYVLHDETLPTYLGSKIYPLSGQAKISFMPFKRNWGYLGIGLRASYSRLEYKEDTYTIDGNLGTGHFLFIYQLPMFRRRVVAEIHAGAGVTYFNNIIFHFPHNMQSPALNTLSPSADAGLSVQFYINKRLYTEIAADYIFTMNKDMILGMVQPSLGVGWQF